MLNQPEIPKADVGIRIGELRRVEGIEKLSAELKICLFAEAPYLKQFTQGYVKVTLIRSPDYPATEISKIEAISDHRWSTEDVRIKKRI